MNAIKVVLVVRSVTIVCVSSLTKLIAAGNGLTSLAAPWRWESRALTLLDLASNKIEAVRIETITVYHPHMCTEC